MTRGTGWFCRPNALALEALCSRPRPAWPRGESRGLRRKNPPHDRGSATALDPDVGLVYPPTVVGRFEFRAQTSFHFWRIALDPPPDGDVIGVQAPLGQQLLNITIGKRKTQIPTNRQMNHFRFKIHRTET